MSQMPPQMPLQGGETFIPGDPISYSTPGKLSGMALTSMILGVLSIPLGFVLIGVILGLVALILGIIALAAINRQPQRFGGKGYAITGMVTGAMGMIVIGPLLLAILLQSLAEKKFIANLKLCTSNLRVQGTAFSLYAAMSSDNLPNFAGGPNLNDLGADNVKALMGVVGGAGFSAPKMFNCPFNGSSSATSGTAMSYVYFTDRPGLDPAMRTFLTPAAASNRTSGMLPPVVLHSTWSREKNPAATELVADEIISASNPPGARDFASVGGQATNHMAGSNLPSGENVLHCDSHLSWRAWSGSNATAIKQGGGYYLWVIDP